MAGALWVYFAVGRWFRVGLYLFWHDVTCFSSCLSKDLLLSKGGA